MAYQTEQRVPVQPGVQTGDCQWARVSFVTPIQGFAGLACDGSAPVQMDVTHDGGLSWQRTTLPPLSGPAGILMASGVESPKFLSETQGVAFVWNCVGGGHSCAFSGALKTYLDRKELARLRKPRVKK